MGLEDKISATLAATQAEADSKAAEQEQVQEQAKADHEDACKRLIGVATSAGISPKSIFCSPYSDGATPECSFINSDVACILRHEVDAIHAWVGGSHAGIFALNEDDRRFPLFSKENLESLLVKEITAVIRRNQAEQATPTPTPTAQPEPAPQPSEPETPPAPAS